MEKIKLPMRGQEFSNNELMAPVLENIAAVSNIDSLSTKEGNLRSYLLDQLRQFGVEGRVDAKGNVWVESKAPEGEILLCAHMDKIGPGNKAIIEKGELQGRLDDSAGIGIILGMIKAGYRPSMLFTVEEEYEHEVADAEGKSRIKSRELPDGIYSAGARFAADEIREGKAKKPKLIINIDVSARDNIGNGPLVYVSSRNFRFPSGPAKDVLKLLQENNLQAQFIDGAANDSIEFSFLEKQGVLCVEIPIKNYHSANETADLGDIKEAVEIIKTILQNHNQIQNASDTPIHASYSNPIEL
ncbi:MAG: hypothetical protein WC858_02315 [Parcubacteria group bacterium]|jgi:putative aminopeptidase FrvX